MHEPSSETHALYLSEQNLMRQLLKSYLLIADPNTVNSAKMTKEIMGDLQTCICLCYIRRLLNIIYIIYWVLSYLISLINIHKYTKFENKFTYIHNHNWFINYLIIYVVINDDINVTNCESN